MSQFCNFQPLDSAGSTLWRCTECGFQTHKRFKLAPSRVCKRPINRPEVPVLKHYLICPHRGRPIATVRGSDTGCGCSGTTVEVYQCRLLGRPTLKDAKPRCLDRLRKKVRGYDGLTCRECEVMKPKPPVRIVLPPAPKLSSEPKELTVAEKRRESIEVQRWLNKVADREFGPGAALILGCRPVQFYRLLVNGRQIAKGHDLEETLQAGHRYVRDKGRPKQLWAPVCSCRGGKCGLKKP